MRWTASIVGALWSFGLAAAAFAQPAPSTGALPDVAPQTFEVVVGPGAKALDPVAVPDPKCDGEGETCAMVAEVLRNDLKITGFFQLLPTKTFIADPNTPIDSPNFPDWFNVGAKYLVLTEVTKAGSATNLKFKLYNVIEKSEVQVKVRSFTGVMRGDLRYRVHDFVNAMLEALTGKPGVFGSRIVYSAKTGDWTRGIFAMDMDGHGAGSVVSDDRINSLPSFANGDVLYTSQGDREDPVIMIGKRKLSKSAGQFRKAVLGPGGSYAVSVDTGSGSDIWLMDGGGNLTRNLTGGQGDNVSPSWSPDGGMIAFVSNRSGGPQVYVMDAGGGGQRRVTMAGSYNSTPDFGPDGKIVFAGLDGGNSDIFVTDINGAVTRITQDQGWNKDPVWSPDGRWIAFVSSREGGRIFISTADGRYQFPVSRKPCSCATPFWR